MLSQKLLREFLSDHGRTFLDWQGGRHALLPENTHSHLEAALMNFNRGGLNMKFLTLTLATALAVAFSGCSPSTTEKPAVSPAASAAAPVNTYTTNFPLKESPISEGGRSIDAKSVGIDWGYLSTTPGLAVGHAGPKRFADSAAFLNGTWGPNQSVEAVVESKKTVHYPEVSLRLRSDVSAHNCQGYEISYSLKSDDTAYLIMVRWNGGLADFTYLAQLHGKQYSVKTGDVVKATIVGNVITTYKNGVQMGQVKDNTYLTGRPGFGFNEGTNGDYGITRFTATDAPAAASPAANPADKK